jgi:hypothetical protein
VQIENSGNRYKFSILHAMTAITNLLDRWAGWLAIAGGLLWIVYAVLATLQPLGNVATYIDDFGQIAATNPTALRVSGVTGGGALILLGLTIVGVAVRYNLPGAEPARFGGVAPSRYGVAMAWVGALAGLLAAAMALLPLVLPNNAMYFFAAVLIPFAAMLVAIEANGSEHAVRIAAPLFLVGALGMAGLLAQALIPLATWMLPVYGALAMAVYGFAWVRFGSLLISAADLHT